MSSANINDHASQSLIQHVSNLVMQETGVQLGTNQQAMVYFRMRKRMTDLGIDKAEAYIAHLEENRDLELPALVSLLTTHHTYFFREFTQFEHIEVELLPKMLETFKDEGRDTLRIWSAACSRGQEVYSLAMFFLVHLQKMAPHIKVEILGTDVDPESVKIAENGVYRWDEIKEIPSTYLQNFWARGTGEIQNYVKVKKNLKALCKFKALNLFENLSGVGDKKFDFIFCRNVFIYFNKTQIEDCSRRLLERLDSNGRLFIGVSESLNGLKLPVKLNGPSVYKHFDQQASVIRPSPVLEVKSTSAPRVAANLPIRVVCVDDSPTVLTLLKKILSRDHGFEIVATAVNGIDAESVLQKIHPDVITLDIHMPEKNGLEFLRDMQGKACPPVVVVSSVSRDDASTGLKMLEYGAKDYIEKPSMQDLNARADEIRMKVKLAARKPEVHHGLDKAFSRVSEIKSPDKCLRIIVAGYAHRDQVVELYKKFSKSSNNSRSPGILLLIHGAENLFAAFARDLNEKLGRGSESFALEESFKENGCAIAHFSTAFSFTSCNRVAKQSIMVLGDLPEVLVDKLKEVPGAHILVEDLGAYRSPSYVPLRLLATRALPLTSFDYHSTYYLAGGGK